MTDCDGGRRRCQRQPSARAHDGCRIRAIYGQGEVPYVLTSRLFLATSVAPALATRTLATERSRFIQQVSTYVAHTEADLARQALALLHYLTPIQFFAVLAPLLLDRPVKRFVWKTPATSGAL